MNNIILPPPAAAKPAEAEETESFIRFSENITMHTQRNAHGLTDAKECTAATIGAIFPKRMPASRVP